MKKYLLLLLLLGCAGMLLKAQQVEGRVFDSETGEGLPGAQVFIEGGKAGALTDGDGNFSFRSPVQPPFKLFVTFVSYDTLITDVTSLDKSLKLGMIERAFTMNTVEIVGRNISEKEREAPLTVESMGSIAIKEVASSDFYASLGNMKGVDLTSASLGFKVINTRGFNSTSPIRSLQIIDGVDNQAPGLNFSLGNFLGSSELDVQKIDLIVGASSAFYGPNAFNGVISMTTKNPFVHQGLSVKGRVGERNLAEVAVRYAKAFQNKDGEDKFAFKVNASFLRADDWEATNSDPTPQSEVGRDNPGGYDAVNTYGDENLSRGINNATGASQEFQFPGLGIWHRDGYQEQDLVDYNTENLKLAAAMHFKVLDSAEVIASSNFGTGTTVYQGDNRYSLRDILFFQHRLELKKDDKYFIRTYYTHEDAGNSYDATFTAFLIQDAAKTDVQWSQDYRNYWAVNISPQVQALDGYPQFVFGQPFDFETADSVIAANSDQIQAWHDEARDVANSANPVTATLDRFEPGTASYDSLKNEITSRTSFTEGGTRFFDKSALWHIHGEYKFDPTFLDDITVGGNFRRYMPNSQGTIFSDTNGVVITNQEFGAYAGVEKKLLGETLKLNAAMRIDKNQNFDWNFSPAASAVYFIDEKNILRGSFSSAIRNPTLAEQYLFYNVGRAILLGNINGFDSLVTIESLGDYFDTQDPDDLAFTNVAPIRTEKVRSFEVGYRTTIKERLFLDMSYYYSFYRDFIGFQVGATVNPVDVTGGGVIYNLDQVYRITANSDNVVTTQGFSIGANYYFKKLYVLNANYSWNRLNQLDVEDPILPAFNTPEHKFNVGVGGRNINLKFGEHNWRNFGFNTNFKWVEGFEFVGSPQFTGFVPTYYMLDGQVNKTVDKIHTTFKLGGSNLLNRQQLQVFGGPYVGRLVYFSVQVELDKL